MELLKAKLTAPGLTTICNTPDGVDALILAEAIGKSEEPIIYIVRDDSHAARLTQLVSFMRPGVKILSLAAWDCLPYDRVSPNSDVVASRLSTLCKLAHKGEGVVDLLLVTVNAALQRVLPKKLLEAASLSAKVNQPLPHDKLFSYLEQNGYQRTGTVREPGEYAVRGGIIDLFPAGYENPVRLDFFDEDLETIRSFDAVSQRTIGEKQELDLIPVSEVLLHDESVALFRKRYRESFGANTENDPLYEAISAGRRYAGMEHWLPFFHTELETILDYLPASPILMDDHVQEALSARWEAVLDYFEARQHMLESHAKNKSLQAGEGAVYKPIAVDSLFVMQEEWAKRLDLRPVCELTSFSMPDDLGGKVVLDAEGKRVTDFASARNNPDQNVFDAVTQRLQDHKKKIVLISAYTEGSKERLSALLKDHGLAGLPTISNWAEAKGLASGQVGLIVAELDRGFQYSNVIVYTEQDILGERLSRPPKRKKRRGEEFITEASALEVSDLVVHVEHGIGRYDGLETVNVEGAPHDCVRLIYAGDDKLFVPVENIEVLSRFGSEDAAAQLDKLGGVAWQARKAKIKERIKIIADKLLKVAAERMLRKGERVAPPEGAYDEFCARFPYSETDDQARAIGEVIEDMGSGRPMDRLVCGDVGFGKTEVALRAAFISALSGQQVAVVVPTTILARQHFKNFESRFSGLPVQVRQLSRLVTTKDANDTKKGLADGTVDIVIGTHALLSKNTSFKNLGLVIIDEEQHFGVTQKERLKEFRANVHVLTLTATPIPRTLQMALSGVREMSIIATPPVDRLAVRTFVTPYDSVVLKEAIYREHFRGGQVYYVCPRIKDLHQVHKQLTELVPDLKIAVAHGQLNPSDLEDVMSDFTDGKYDILLATNIVESGLDIATANTMILHRSDMFGLAQLYQLRGRIGRSKIRAYCYLTLPTDKIISSTARKRLEVMQTLDSLGAGFSLASHDMDIRGAGNLLGDEQSGHVKEVGVELYQRMLEEAVAAAREDFKEEYEETWSPVINLGSAVLIPENYVQDLSVRLGLYRRLSDLSNRKELNAFAVEMADRFGPLPQEVKNLIEVVTIKLLCKKAGIEKMDAGPKGAVVTFRNNEFANPTGLIGFMQQQMGTVKLRPDQKLVVMRPWEDAEKRMSGAMKFADKLARIALAAQKAA
ncbi:transcription-repair coupling factor [Curvivirga sp.]|uniref:transcription-repair coupling factor n=1 Tax=Curvivirga sp. TaxID=2856848 RepID=UPI003B591F47